MMHLWLWHVWGSQAGAECQTAVYTGGAALDTRDPGVGGW